jgi:hypothetical protein
MSTKAPRTIRILHALPFGPAAVVLLLAFSMYPASLDVARERVTEEQTELAPAVPSPSGERAATEDLITAHGCWTEEAPADMAGKWPGGAVIRKANGVVSYTERPGLIDKAIRQALDGEDTRVWAVAFCRGGQR